MMLLWCVYDVTWISCVYYVYICLLNVWFLVFVNYTNHKYRWVPHLKPTFAQPPGDSCGGKLAGPKTELVSEDSQEKKKKLWKGHCNLARPKNLFVALSEQILSFVVSCCVYMYINIYHYRCDVEKIKLLGEVVDSTQPKIFRGNLRVNSPNTTFPPSNIWFLGGDVGMGGKRSFSLCPALTIEAGQLIGSLCSWYW